MTAVGHIRMLRYLARRYIGTCAAESFSEGVSRTAKLTMGELRTRLTPENLMQEVIVRMCSDFVWEKRQELIVRMCSDFGWEKRNEGRGSQATLARRLQRWA